MRILEIITRLVRGGAATHVLALSRALAARGHDLLLVSGPSFGPEGTLEAEVRAAGIALEILPDLVRDADPLRDLLAAATLHRTLARRRFDVVHSHTSKAGVLGRWIARASGVPVVVHSPHGHVFEENARIPGVSDQPAMRALFYVIERLSSRIAHRTIALTGSERAALIRLRLALPDRLVVVPNGVSDHWLTQPVMDRPAARVRVGLPPGPWVGLVGRLAGEKGHTVAFEAFAAVARARPDARLAVVGDGPLRPFLEQLAAAPPLAGRVRFLGSRADVRDVYAALDLLVQASHYEAFGLAILEAMACGCPVVATAVGGVPEVVEHGATGLLVPPADPTALASAILAVLEDPAAAADRARVAQTQVARRFTVSQMADRIEAVYRETLDRRGST